MVGGVRRGRSIDQEAGQQTVHVGGLVVFSRTLVVSESSHPVADGGVGHSLLRMCLTCHGHHFHVPDFTSFELRTGLGITHLAGRADEGDAHRLIKLLSNLLEAFETRQDAGTNAGNIAFDFEGLEQDGPILLCEIPVSVFVVRDAEKTLKSNLIVKPEDRLWPKQGEGILAHLTACGQNAQLLVVE